MLPTTSQDRSANDARGRTARSADALPDASPRRGEAPTAGAQSPGSIDREALLRAMVATLPRARARAALGVVRRWLHVVLGAAEVHGLVMLRAAQSPADGDAMLDAAQTTLDSAAVALLALPDEPIVGALAAVLIGSTVGGYPLRFGMCSPANERRDALRALRIVGRVSRELRATTGGAA